MSDTPLTRDLDALRRTAKRLKKSADAGDAEALARLRAAIADPPASWRHADALHAIAREAGFESWPKLKFSVEAAALSRAERVERLKRALFYGQHWIVEKLTAEAPDLAAGDFALEIATYDRDAVTARLARDASAATETLGRRSPLLHLAYSQHIHAAPEKKAAMLAIAEALVDAGADVNDSFPAEPGSEHRLSALYGALGHANNMALAEWLLARGATPDDDESLYHATELGHHDGLKLLIRHGVKTAGTNALLRAMDFGDVEAVRLLLAHGADPNEGLQPHPSGQPVTGSPALHHAARRWCSGAMVDLLLDHGADARSPHQGRSAYAFARVMGAQAVSETLARRGFASPLSPAETVLAACAQGAAPAEPLDPAQLSEEDQRIATRIVWMPTTNAHLEALFAAGVDPNATEEMEMTALHVAAWEGLPERVALLLRYAPDLGYVNAYGGDALGTLIHGAEFCPNAAQRDHIGCARLLLEAGADLRDSEIAACGAEDLAVFLEEWRDQATG